MGESVFWNYSKRWGCEMGENGGRGVGDFMNLKQANKHNKQLNTAHTSLS